MATQHPTDVWEVLDGRLAEDEQVWVELAGTGGQRVVGTDRRLLALSGDRVTADWSWEEVDDVVPTGPRSTIRIRRRDRTTEIEIEPTGDTATVMQAVTVLALLAVDAARYGARIDALRRAADDPDVAIG
jgi:hypothetical protein